MEDLQERSDFFMQDINYDNHHSSLTAIRTRRHAELLFKGAVKIG